MKVLSLWKGEVDAPRTMNQIGQYVAEKHRLTVADLKRDPTTPRQTPRAIAYPRQEAMWMMSSQTNADGSAKWSYSMIAGWFGVDHTTVYTGSKAHARRNGVDLLPRVVGGWRFAA
jgi:chromosomal replication initiation ATPase DnaA